ncbi:MAG: DUF2304 domain-containing protein, partial [Otoolea sp.]
MKLFHMSIKMSQLESRIRELAQEMALEKNEREKKKREKKEKSEKKKKKEKKDGKKIDSCGE